MGHTKGNYHPGVYKTSKHLKKGYKPIPPSTGATQSQSPFNHQAAITTSDRLLGGDRKLIQDYQFYETVKRARQGKSQTASLSASIDALKTSSETTLRVVLFCAQLIGLMYALLTLD